MRRDPRTILLAAGLAATWAFSAAAETLEVPSVDYPTIAAAIDASVDGDTIVLQEGVYTEFDLELDKNITIRSEQGPENTVLDADWSGRIFIVTGDVTIEGFTLRHGFTNDRGGAILVDGGEVRVVDCDFRNNTAKSIPGVPVSGVGGAIAFNNGGGGLLKDCGFYENRAGANDPEAFFDNTGLGGAIDMGGGANVTVLRCQFDGNEAIGPGVGGNGVGGAILVGGSSPSQLTPASHLKLVDSTFTGNSAAISAGAVWIQGLNDGEDPNDPALAELGLSTATVTRCFFSDNSAQAGGALFVFRFGRLTVSDSMFFDNFTYEENNFVFPGLQGGGAAIASAGGLDAPDGLAPDGQPFRDQATVTDSVFMGNDARGLRGGAIYNSLASKMNLFNSEFRDNRGAFGGGAITNEAGTALFGGAPAELNMVNCLVAYNEADGPGGGVINIEGSTLWATNCRFEGNTAIKGGAVANESGSTLTTVDCMFEENTVASIEPSTGWGGAILCTDEGSTMLVDGCSFIGNAAITTDPEAFFDNTGLGGAMFVTRGAEATVIGSSFNDNAAMSSGIGGNGIGGAIFLAGSSTAEERLPSTLTVEASSFTGNNAAVSGGAMWLQGVDGELFVGASSASINECIFQGNFAEAGGAIFGFTLLDLEVANSEFVNNYTVEGPFIIPGLQGGGGAIANAIFCNVQISESCFLNNQGTYGRGGAVNNLFGTTTMMLDCEFRGNEAALGGGAVANEAALPIGGGPASMTLINCLFACNTTPMMGGGVGNFEGGNLTAINCTFADNEATAGGGLVNAGEFQALDGEGNPVGDPVPSEAMVGNSILFGNGRDQIAELDGSASTVVTMVTYSLVQEGWPGMGNIDADPLFVGFGCETGDGDGEGAQGCFAGCLGFDYRLCMKSPAIDAGNNFLKPDEVDFDLAGNPRIVQEIIDMGCYEYQGE